MQTRSHGDILIMSEAVPDLTVTRWKRYGKDRLYVTGVDARPFGWWDLLAAEGHPESADLASALDGAVSAWLARDDQTTSIEMTQGVVEPAATAQVSDADSLPSAGAEPDVELIPGPTPRSSVKHPVDLSGTSGALASEAPRGPASGCYRGNLWDCPPLNDLTTLNPAGPDQCPHFTVYS